MTDTSTLKGLENALAPFPESAALVFYSEDGPIRPDYHITELKYARIDSVDCGGRMAQWHEAILQVVDGPQDAPGGTHLELGKAKAILTRAAAALPGVEALPLSIEFGPGNAVLQSYHAGVPVLKGSAVHVPLLARAPECKVLTQPTPQSIERPVVGCCK